MKTSAPSFLRAAGFLALALVAGCDSTEVRHPRRMTTVSLSAEGVAQPIEMGLVSAVQVVLPGPATGSGYAWEIASNNIKVLEQMGPLKVVAGPAPTTVVSFYSLKPGKSVLRFFLVRPSDTDAVPAGSREVTVRVTE